MPRKTDRQRLTEAVDDAFMAFWAKIREAYPEVKTGNLPPRDKINVVFHFENVGLEAVQIWVAQNKPKPAETEQVFHAIQDRLKGATHSDRVTYEYPGCIDVQVTPGLIMGFDDQDGFIAICKDPENEYEVIGQIDTQLNELDLTDPYVIADAIIKVTGLVQP